MKKNQGKRHKPEQIIRKLREADTMLAAGKTIGQVVQVLEISEQTFHRRVALMKSEFGCHWLLASQCWARYQLF